MCRGVGFRHHPFRSAQQAVSREDTMRSRRRMSSPIDPDAVARQPDTPIAPIADEIIAAVRDPAHCKKHVFKLLMLLLVLAGSAASAFLAKYIVK